VSVPVANMDAVCSMHCVSVICPVAFPSHLITTHTSTATTVVDDTTFYDVMLSSWQSVARPIAAVAAMMASFNSA